MSDTTDYQSMFRQMLARSVQAALADIDPAAPRLEEVQRDRSLYALSLALDLAETWPSAKELTLAIAPFMETQGYRHEWMNYLEKAIEQATLSADRTALARLQLQLAILHQLMGDYAAADEYLVQCRQVAEEVGDRTLLVLALNRLSASAAEQHQLSKARALVDEILALLDPDDPACAHAYSILGVIAVRHGKFDEARTHYRRVLDLREREGNPHLIAKAYANYMLILNVREDEGLPGVQGRRTIDDPDGNAKEYSKVLSYYQDAIHLYHEAGNLYDEAVAMMNCGLVSWHLGHYDDALNYYAASERLFLRINNRLNLIIVYIDRGCALCEMGRYAEAEQNLTHSVHLAREVGDPFRTYYGLVGLGDLYLRTHRYEDAIGTWNEALGELANLPDAPPNLYEEVNQRLRNAEGKRETPEVETVPGGQTERPASIIDLP